jgi:hypothetical protein
MRFFTWNLSFLYRAHSHITVARGLSKYTLNLLGLQEVRWGRSGPAPADEYTIYSGKKIENVKYVQVS